MVECNLGKVEVAGSIPARSLAFGSRQLVVISFVEWKKDFLSRDYSKDYRKQIIAKLPLIFTKHTYKSQEFIDVISNNYININKSDRSVKLVRLILNWCEEKGSLTDQQLTKIRKKIKNKPSGVDNHVPTDEEVKQTLSQLTTNNRLVYLVYLVNGLRKVEGKFLLTNIHKLKVQQLDGFVKISMNYLRHNKNSYFCYLPLDIYTKLSTNSKQLFVNSLENELRRKKLIPIKYCRKWFYTKCIELGIPESIADYYEGRVSNGIGSTHYLSKQSLADKYYKEKLLGEFGNILLFLK